MQRWLPRFSYLTPPPKQRWHRNALDWMVYCYQYIPMSRRDMLRWKSLPRDRLNDGGRKRLTPWVPHLWRLRYRVDKLRRERTAAI